VLPSTLGASTTAYPGTNGLIVYSVDRVMPSGLHQGDLCLLDPTSGQTARLTRSLEDELQPAWSPDGLRLAYSARLFGEETITSVVYARDLAAGRRRNLTGRRTFDGAWIGTGVSPTWLPNGTEIGFGWRDGIAAIGADGHGRRLVWETRGFPAFVSWSPDGTRVAFVAVIDPGISSTSLLDLETRIAKDIDAQPSSVSWSPDGSRLAQSSGDVRILDLDGREIRRLTSTRADESFAAWSPDGSRIAFEREGDLYTVAVNGSGERRLARTPGIREGYPAWQPRVAGRTYPTPRFRTPCTLLGTDRAETLRGTVAADFAEGRRGDDVLRLERGDDIGKGGEGRDRIEGGAGNDILAGGPGPARDVILCGSGRDSVIAGRRDLVGRDCERVRRSG
jgi:dipeptidyl aminopeptidase/acylaminoacyl peptidase